MGISKMGDNQQDLMEFGITSGPPDSTCEITHKLKLDFILDLGNYNNKVEQEDISDIYRLVSKYSSLRAPTKWTYEVRLTKFIYMRVYAPSQEAAEEAKRDLFTKPDWLPEDIFEVIRERQILLALL